jgi:ATP-binding cassette subfamily A (ABC1) protein 3
LGLEDHRNKPAGTLSGGNKRKVCVAQALVGSPPIILLDEPSAGMDPEARRFMWSVVAKIAQNKTSAVVLTTHSMEEAEALSTKMGIMVKGGIFKCFGSAQHIRDKFGTGYVIELKIRSIEEKDLWDLVKSHYDEKGTLQLKSTTQLDDSVIKMIEQRISGQELMQQYREIYAQTNLYDCIASLCATFTEVEMIEHYGNYMRLKV